MENGSAGADGGAATAEPAIHGDAGKPKAQKAPAPDQAQQTAQDGANAEGPARKKRRKHRKPVDESQLDPAEAARRQRQRELRVSAGGDTARGEGRKGMAPKHVQVGEPHCGMEERVLQPSGQGCLCRRHHTICFPGASRNPTPVPHALSHRTLLCMSK